LRFTKTGDARLEAAYATHFVWPGKSPFHPPVPPERCGRKQPDLAGGGEARSSRSARASASQWEGRPTT
jgi:hypothetical protein